jgi:hypothetical protein
MQTGSCDFIFGAVPPSAVQDRLENEAYHGRPRPLLIGSEHSKSVDSGGLTSHCINSSVADEPVCTATGEVRRVRLFVTRDP